MSTFEEHYSFNYLTSEDGKTFQPKQKNRFAAYMTRLPAAVENAIDYNVNTEKYARQALLLGLQSFNRPNYSVNVVEIPNYNNTFLIPGKDTSERTISMNFIDSYAFEGGAQTLSPASVIYRWYMLVNDKNYNTIGYKDYFTTDIRLFYLFPTGQVSEYWRFYEVWPTAVNFGGLSYGDTEFLNVEVTLKYERARLISEEIDKTVYIGKSAGDRHIYSNEINPGDKISNNPSSPVQFFTPPIP